ncbi:UDP-N-acetylglucosamine 1-carboxyvinyltransferase [Limnochorda pilosa]|uniref:UDP-N-acetylglucosamine 1-carboxyvinyltransferase n=1 Tax=Limnochorda pilosa TaxID=1555112 RepID=A0A0K2SJL1_LIMPI|nr:UDP-N-acetylglucosamine 1-carboxyvinyltransferase [Limnochorda pilosa]BAS27280.1 UDP-N-acetylglucosamine 1-carboxyvinyltransferase [Limnochorda pilosa]
MARLLVEGGRRLQGEVEIDGAKNSALPIMAAAGLAEGESVLERIPPTTDVTTMAQILRELGMSVSFSPGGTCVIDGSRLRHHRAPYDLVRRMRASFYVAGLLLARLGRAEVPLPGGCALGSRPVDFHMRGFEQLGARIRIEHGYMIAGAPRGLHGRPVLVERASVGTTVNLMLAAALAEGTTVLENAAREPEVADLAAFLNRMGARVNGAGGPTVTIEGVRTLHPARHAVIADRVEAGTFLVAAAITRGEVTLRNVTPEHLQAALRKLEEAGARVEPAGPDALRLAMDDRPSPLEVETAPYPGFPTDLHQPMVALLSLARGISTIRETIFDRFRYVDELRRMGAHIRVDGQRALVEGVERLTGAPVEAPDLRGGAALVLAGLAAEGRTEVQSVEHVDRGYDRFEEKLNQLGARIRRVDPDRPARDHTLIPAMGC